MQNISVIMQEKWGRDTYMQKMKKIWDIITTVLVRIVVLLAVLLVGARVIGLQVFTVLSGSMEPDKTVKTCNPITLAPTSKTASKTTILTSTVVIISQIFFIFCIYVSLPHFSCIITLIFCICNMRICKNIL